MRRRLGRWGFIGVVVLLSAVCCAAPVSNAISAYVALQSAANGDGGVVDGGTAADIPPRMLAAYKNAVQRVGRHVPRCRGMRWPVLAGIAKVESNHAAGRTVSAGGDIRPKIYGVLLNGSGAGGNITVFPDTDNGRWDGTASGEEGELLERGFDGWTAGSTASGGVVPLRHDQSAVPGRQGPRGDREDRSPTAAGDECGQRREPEPARGLVAHRPLEPPTQHRVLVPQHGQLRVLGRVAAQEHRRDGQQLPGHLVQQRHDHSRMIPTAPEGARDAPSLAAMNKRAPQDVVFPPDMSVPGATVGTAHPSPLSRGADRGPEHHLPHQHQAGRPRRPRCGVTQPGLLRTPKLGRLG
ncbi:hypothetical protein [Streptomyces viridosporus]|uniref:hypothetical protein n=1 Tax=Streptomyces viridosporus TaxID=67581 RepID=UPI0002EB7303|nr:hypothetical protein [Streptomyces viridosporus]